MVTWRESCTTRAGRIRQGLPTTSGDQTRAGDDGRPGAVVGDLAERAGADPDAVARMLRHLVARGCSPSRARGSSRSTCRYGTGWTRHRVTGFEFLDTSP